MLDDEARGTLAWVYRYFSYRNTGYSNAGEPVRDSPASVFPKVASNVCKIYVQISTSINFAVKRFSSFFKNEPSAVLPQNLTKNIF